MELRFQFFIFHPYLCRRLRTEGLQLCNPDPIIHTITVVDYGISSPVTRATPGGWPDGVKVRGSATVSLIDPVFHADPARLSAEPDSRDITGPTIPKNPPSAVARKIQIMAPFLHISLFFPSTWAYRFSESLFLSPISTCLCLYNRIFLSSGSTPFRLKTRASGTGPDQGGVAQTNCAAPPCTTCF